MNANFLVFVLTSHVFLTMADFNSTALNVPGHRRSKRHLVFRASSKFFFRMNIKDNLLPYTVIFAHAYGFRVNFDLPETFNRRHRIGRRDVYETLEDMMNRHGFNGKACVAETLCAASNVVTSESGILWKIYQKIFKIIEDDDPYLSPGHCDKLERRCPFSLSDLSGYSDW